MGDEVAAQGRLEHPRQGQHRRERSVRQGRLRRQLPLQPVQHRADRLDRLRHADAEAAVDQEHRRAQVGLVGQAVEPADPAVEVPEIAKARRCVAEAALEPVAPVDADAIEGGVRIVEQGAARQDLGVRAPADVVAEGAEHHEHDPAPRGHLEGVGGTGVGLGGEEGRRLADVRRRRTDRRGLGLHRLLRLRGDDVRGAPAPNGWRDINLSFHKPLMALLWPGLQSGNVGCGADT